MSHWARRFDQRRSQLAERPQRRGFDFGHPDSREGRRKRQGDGGRSPLDDALLEWVPGAVFTHRHAAEGILDLGSNGAGKSRGSLRFVTRAMLRSGYGAVVTTTKPGDTADFIALAEEAGRAHDLRVVRPGAGYRLNPIGYLMACGDGQHSTENVVHFLKDLAALTTTADQHGGDPIWEKAMAMLIRNAVDLLLIASEPVTLKTIASVVSGCPKSLVSMQELRRRLAAVVDGAVSDKSLSFFEQLWVKAATSFDAGETLIDRHSFDETLRFWCESWPSTAEKTRSSVEFTLNTTLDSMLRGQMADILCGDTTIRPEDMFNGALVVLDFSLKEWGDEGRIVQAVFKYVFQKGMERRRLKNSDSGRPCALIVDECQEFLTPHDLSFQATARSARACTVFATQNIASLRKRLGHDGTETLTGLLQTKIFHSNDTETNEWASRCIGQDWDYRTSLGGDLKPAFSEEMMSIIDSIEFAKLARGGPDFGNVTQAFVFKPGARWGVNGDPFVLASFRTD